MNSSSPVVSIVVPTYNREHLLPIAVGSVRAQTFGDWELLLVDDQSTDGTRKLIEGWAADDPRIRYILNERTKGPSGARNTGIDQSRGRYVAFLDSDDEWLPYHLERSVHYLEQYPDKVDVVSAGAIKKRRDTGETYNESDLAFEGLRKQELENAWLFPREEAFNQVFCGGGILVQQTIVARRELLRQSMYDEAIPPGPEDGVFHMELAYHRPGIAHVRDAHVIYWAHGGNLTCSGGMNSVSQRIHIFEAFEVAASQILKKFNLTRRQQRALKNHLADICVWQIGYNAHLAAGKFSRARRYFLKGILLSPLRFRYWKTLVASCFKQIASNW